MIVIFRLKAKRTKMWGYRHQEPSTILYWANETAGQRSYWVNSCNMNTYIFQWCDWCTFTSIIRIPINVKNFLSHNWHHTTYDTFLKKKKLNSCITGKTVKSGKQTKKFLPTFLIFTYYALCFIYIICHVHVHECCTFVG